MRNTAIENLNAFGTLVAGIAAAVGVGVAIFALWRPESLQAQKDLQALASARNLAFFAYRENILEFQLAASGHHTTENASFETVLVGLQAIKLEQVPPHLTEDFINIWSQTRRAQRIAAANSAVPIDTDYELRLAQKFLRAIDGELIRSGASFDTECKAVIEPKPAPNNGCVQYR